MTAVGTIKVVCAWCKRVMGHKPVPIGTLWYGPPISHGICRACHAAHFPKVKVTQDMALEWQLLDDSLTEGKDGR